MDIIYMYPVINHYFKFIGKKELRKWLMIGVFFRKGMDISISRENAKEARISLDEAMAALNRGVSVAIFPEGEIPIDTPQLKRFKNGGFKMALATQKPILPVTFLSNHERLHEPHTLFGKCTPGLCEVIIHPRIETQGMDLMDIAPLRNKVYEVINGPLVERGLSRSPNFANDEN
jgi:1-acyl-sn-glycerol-3-phosphate acyltransferase